MTLVTGGEYDATGTGDEYNTNSTSSGSWEDSDDKPPPPDGEWVYDPNDGQYHWTVNEVTVTASRTAFDFGWLHAEADFSWRNHDLEALRFDLEQSEGAEREWEWLGDTFDNAMLWIDRFNPKEILEYLAGRTIDQAAENEEEK